VRNAAERGLVPPIAVLFGLNLVDELDRLAFAALTPELRDAFGLSDTQIVGIGALAGLCIMLGALPVGWLGDRYPRMRIVILMALLWSAMSVLTALAWAVWVLIVARMLSGVARTSSEVVHPTLLVDYYEPVAQPRAFRIHRLAAPISTAFALVIGGVGALVGWRWTFALVAVPTWLLVLAALTVREPPRATRSVLDLGTGGPGVWSVLRQALRIPTLRRLWGSAFLLGATFIANTQLLSLFFERVHGYGAFGRGVVQGLYGIGMVVGILIGARLATRIIFRDDWGRLTALIGAGVAVMSLALLLLSVTPWAPVALAVCVLLGIGMGSYQPAFYPLLARVVPAETRSRTFGWTLLVTGLGAGLAVPLARVGELTSYRVTFGVFAASVLAGALVIASARRGVVADIAAAGHPVGPGSPAPSPLV
jgi:MFS family permease